ncbi:unnamed protein product, partial [Prorocentrum cordatum]
MAREGGAFLRPVRSAEARRASRAWARWSADRAVAKRVEELQAVRGQLAAAEAALDYIVGDAEVAQRLSALLPAFVATLHGVEPTWLEKLRRNVALHAEALEIDVAIAGARELRRAQRGPRLEARRAGVGRAPTSLSADAAEFMLGTWEALPVGPSVHVAQDDSEIHELSDAEKQQAQPTAEWLAPGVWHGCGPTAESAAQAFVRSLAAGWRLAGLGEAQGDEELATGVLPGPLRGVAALAVPCLAELRAVVPQLSADRDGGVGIVEHGFDLEFQQGVLLQLHRWAVPLGRSLQPFVRRRLRVDEEPEDETEAQADFDKEEAAQLPAAG